MVELGKTILNCIPNGPTSAPAPYILAVKEIRATLSLNLKSAMALVQLVRGKVGEVVVYSGDMVEAEEFADRLVDCGRAAKAVPIDLPHTYTFDFIVDWLKDTHAGTLSGNNQAAFRVVIDTLDGFGD